MKIGSVAISVNDNPARARFSYKFDQQRLAQGAHSAPLSAGSDAHVRALVRGLPAESAPRRGNDAGARRICRAHHGASLGNQNVADVGRCFPATQTTRWAELEDGRDLHQGIRSVEVPLPVSYTH